MAYITDSHKTQLITSIYNPNKNVDIKPAHDHWDIAIVNMTISSVAVSYFHVPYRANFSFNSTREMSNQWRFCTGARGAKPPKSCKESGLVPKFQKWLGLYLD